MGIGIDPPRPAPISPTRPDPHLLLIILQKYWFLLLCDHNILGKINSKQIIFVCVY
jgi:hypothetical protein